MSEPTTTQRETARQIAERIVWDWAHGWHGSLERREANPLIDAIVAAIDEHTHMPSVSPQRKVTKRYCGPCDKWVPAKQTVCKACGADTDKADRRQCYD